MRFSWKRLPLSTLVLLGLLCEAAHAQAPAPASPAPSAGAAAPSSQSGPDVLDSSVGYVDSALPRDQLRLRFDTAYSANRPTRAEFFYPKGGAAGRGLP